MEQLNGKIFDIENVGEKFEKLGLYYDNLDLKEPEQLAAEIFNSFFSEPYIIQNCEYKEAIRYNNGIYLNFEPGENFGYNITFEVLPWFFDEFNECDFNDIYEQTIENLAYLLTSANTPGQKTELIEKLERLINNKTEVMEYTEKALTAYSEILEIIQGAINSEIEPSGKLAEYALLYNIND